jgi:hypothetical protein
MNGDFSPGLEARAPTLLSRRSAESLVFLRAEFAFRAFSLKHEKRNTINMRKYKGNNFASAIKETMAPT